MLTVQRRKIILELLKSQGQVSVAVLSGQWGVSEDTVRRDLRDLAADGLVQRVHGGALPASLALGDFSQREAISPQAKIKIGQRAAALIRNGQVVLVDGGTTTREMVRALPVDLRATIVTHSPTIAQELAGHGGVEVILLGGRLFKHSVVALGAEALGALSRIRGDLFFLGATGIHPEAGATTGDYEEAAMKRAMCRAAAETYLLVSPEKLGAVSPYQIVPATELTGLVVDGSTPDASMQVFKSMGLSIITA